MVSVRLMTLADMPEVMAIQAVCYTEIVPESLVSMRAKLLATPNTCFVATHNNTINAYLIALPWELANPPALDAITCTIPATPNCLYLHDLAVAPAGRNSGIARLLVEHFLTQVTIWQFDNACLIAIQDSAPYWQRYGFHVMQTSSALTKKLLSYGENVAYMEYTTYDK